jgi:hypothetical protein
MQLGLNRHIFGCVFWSSALTPNSLELEPWVTFLSLRVMVQNSMSFATTSSDLKALPYQFRRYPIHAKHRDTTKANSYSYQF